MAEPTGTGTNLPKWIVSYVLLVFLVALFFLQPTISTPIGRLTVSMLFLTAILLVLCYAATLLARRWMQELEFSPRDYRIVSISLFALFMGGALLLFLFYSGEREIKVYDFSAYWIHLLEDRETAARSLPALVERLVSTLSNDYTHVAVIPLIPASYVFGVQY